jgi:hypothetical protein
LVFGTGLVKLDTELDPSLNESGDASNSKVMLCKKRWEFIGTVEEHKFVRVKDRLQDNLFHGFKQYNKDKSEFLILIAIRSSRATLNSGDGRADYVIPN